MNRKDRRAEERRAAQMRPASALPGDFDPDVLFTQAAAFDRAGDAAAAQKVVRAVLARHPAHVPSLILAGDLAQRDERNNAAIKLLGQALTLQPGNATAHDCIAMAYQASGRRDDAVRHFREAIALGLGGVEGLVKQGRATAGPLSRLLAAWPRQLSLSELLGPAGAAALAGDAMLIALLQSKAACDWELERLLTAVRRGLLEHVAGGSPAMSDSELEFFCVLAQQCFINEFVYALGDAERSLHAKLRDSLIEAASAGMDVPASWLVTTATYAPLHELPPARELLARAWPPSVARLLAQQVREPLEEISDRSRIPALTPVDNAVSLKVRAQYEENPYPRWTILARPQATTLDAYLRDRLRLTSWPDLGAERPDILIAGCGTGAHSIETARRFPQSQVLAVDISLASLAYARRKTREAGLSNIEYAQADILKLGALERRFDAIEVVGVLHHLAEPGVGWRILLSLLRPGGVMLVGLYSALARRPINAARAFIAERGFRPTADDIRACRQEMVHRGIGAISADFFTTSRCRDLYFHPVEHQFAIGEIKSFLAAHGLGFLGFEISPETQPQAEQQIPPAGWADLDRWDAFEHAQPRAFAGMYIFWVQQTDAKK